MQILDISKLEDSKESKYQFILTSSIDFIVVLLKA